MEGTAAPQPADKPSANTVYVGCRTGRGDPHVTANGRELSALPSQKVWNHSPDGFEWGYSGSGPSQLALALLLHATAGNTITALSLYHRYKFAVVSRWPRHGWATTRSAILRWIADEICPINDPPPVGERGGE